MQTQPEILPGSVKRRTWRALPRCLWDHGIILNDLLKISASHSSKDAISVSVCVCGKGGVRNILHKTSVSRQSDEADICVERIEIENKKL